MEEDNFSFFEVQAAFAQEETTEMKDTEIEKEEFDKVDPRAIDLAQKELMSIHTKMHNMGVNAMRAYLTRRGAQPWVIALAGQLKFSICEATARRHPMPVAAGIDAEPFDALQMDGFDWIRTATETRARGALMIDEGSAKSAPVIHYTAPNKGNTGETSAAVVRETFVNDWA
eukprot:8577222-Pyramimonas_sp.AAC.1